MRGYKTQYDDPGGIYGTLILLFVALLCFIIKGCLL
jgi:hypothetical protein